MLFCFWGIVIKIKMRPTKFSSRPLAVPIHKKVDKKWKSKEIVLWRSTKIWVCVDVSRSEEEEREARYKDERCLHLKFKLVPPSTLAPSTLQQSCMKRSFLLSPLSRLIFNFATNDWGKIGQKLPISNLHPHGMSIMLNSTTHITQKYNVALCPSIHLATSK